MKAHEHLSASAFRSIQKLTQKKHRHESGKFLVEGIHLLGEAIDAGVGLELIVLTGEAREKPEVAALEKRAGSMGIPRYTVSSREMERLSDAVTSQGILGVASMVRRSLDLFWPAPGTPSLIVALEHVADPGNVGTILRTCDWFGVDALLLGGQSVELHNPKVVRSSMGALFHLPVFSDVKLPAVLAVAKEHGYEIAVTALSGGAAFSARSLSERTVIVFGNEASGVSRETIEVADRIVTIQRYGRGESLNVGAACAVILGSAKIR